MKRASVYLFLGLAEVAMSLFVLRMAAAVVLNSEFDALKTTRLPLNAVSSVSIASCRRIAVGVGSFSRVQLFDSNGTFLHAIPVLTNGGQFHVHIDDHDTVYIIPVRSATNEYQYSLDGKRLGVRVLSVDDLVARRHREQVRRRDLGVRVVITNRIVDTTIKVFWSDNTLTVIRDPWWCIPFGSPVAPALFLLVALAIRRSAISSAYVSRKGGEPNASHLDSIRVVHLRAAGPLAFPGSINGGPIIEFHNGEIHLWRSVFDDCLIAPISDTRIVETRSRLGLYIHIAVIIREQATMRAVTNLGMALLLKLRADAAGAIYEQRVESTSRFAVKITLFVICVCAVGIWTLPMMIALSFAAHGVACLACGLFYAARGVLDRRPIGDGKKRGQVQYLDS